MPLDLPMATTTTPYYANKHSNGSAIGRSRLRQEQVRAAVQNMTRDFVYQSFDTNIYVNVDSDTRVTSVYPSTHNTPIDDSKDKRETS